MFSRQNLLIVVLALTSAAVGLLASRWMQAPPQNVAIERGVTTLQIGDRRDDDTLPDRAGTRTSLTQWDGKLILVNFWASWCGPCREEMPLLDSIRKRHGSKGLEVVGIATEDAPAANRFLEQFPVSYPILINDPATSPDWSIRYGNTRNVLPYSVLIGRDGRIVEQRIGTFDEAGLEAWLKPHL
ncbi:MAG: TlpA disulfide reductase family protein [Dokdonella sp.]